MELVIFVGLQASGKSSFFESRFSPTHVHVSKDRLPGSSDKNKRQLRLIEEALRSGRSVVVDNTNPGKADRKTLIDLGKQYGAKITGYYFESILKECLERNRRRTQGHVPAVALYTTAKKLVPPELDEGFDDLFSVRVVEDGYKVAQLSER